MIRQEKGTHGNSLKSDLGDVSDNLNSVSPIELKVTDYDGIKYVCPTWDQMGEYTFQLSQDIIASGQHFDRVVALAKGGWTWTRALIDYLQIDEVSSVRIKSYSGVNESSEPKIIQPLTDSIKGERILVFDEVIDSGETIRKAKSYFSDLGAKEITVASLCYKPRSIMTPDYFAFSTDAWVVFPHEEREFIDGSLENWSSKGISPSEAKERLHNIGLPDRRVSYFVGLQKLSEEKK